MRIVLIEDNTMLARAVIQALQDEGHAVDWLANGADGAEFLSTQGADLAIGEVGHAGDLRVRRRLVEARHCRHQDRVLGGELLDRRRQPRACGAVQVEDCGPCVQTGVNLMKQDGVPLDLIRAALEGKLKPREEIVHLGRAVIRDTFKISRVGTIAGCYVTQGTIERSAKVRVIREGVVVYPR